MSIIAALSSEEHCMTIPANIQSIIKNVLLLVGAYGVLFLFALILWVFRDIRSRTRDIFLQILATLLVLVFNIPGLLLYFVLRPRHTLEEAYEHALGQEAMLQDIEERFICPSCHRKTEPDFILCPHCHTPLRHQCAACGRIIHLNWTVCPYCGQEQDAPSPQPPEQAEELPEISTE